MILGIDVGGTAVKLGLMTREGQILAREEAPVNADGYATPVLTSVLRAAERFLQSRGADPEGIAVSATGQVDDRQGIVIGTNGSIPGYEGTDFQSAFRSRFGVPVHVLNDANAAALGETFLGAGKGCRDVLMVTLGTGVGGGVVSGGRLVRGHRGIAGELGHFSIDRGGLPCPCGGRGCFERYASATALITMAREASPDDPVRDGRDFFARVRGGDGAMSGVLDRWLDGAALGLAGLIHIFNPEIVLIGGGISSQQELLITPLRKKVFGLLMPRFSEGLRLEAALLGNDAGMIGALKYWLDQEESK